MTELEFQPVEHLAITAAIGWVVANLVRFTVGAAGAAGAIRGCVGAFQDTFFDSAFFCGLGLTATIGDFGCKPASDVRISTLRATRLPNFLPKISEKTLVIQQELKME